MRRLERVYDAPVSAVWEAWTDPALVAQWWGPRGFTITTHSKDLKPGGHWSYTMHGPDGVDYPNTTKYLEVEEYKRLVYDHGADENQKPLFRVTVTFLEKHGKTTMDMTMALASPEAAEKTRAFIKKAGGNTTWDRLAEYLEKQLAKKEVFVINRSFDAPIETVFEMWSDAKHLAAWLPPVGFKAEFMRSDIRPGGTSFYCMSNDAGMKMYGRCQYLEIEKANLIVYTQQFVDENENLSRHPMAPTWPSTMFSIIELAAEDDGQTRVTVTTQCYGDTTPEELATFMQGRSSMTIGFTGSFDKLDDYLSKLVR